ncbi:hypothetical protein GCM10010193_41110 [Kitasatospora atroaurantiaca]
MERTHDGLTITEVAGLVQIRALRRRYGLRWISATPINLYGPGRHPDDTPRKLLDASRLLALGRRARIGLPDGSRTTCDWYLRGQAG